MKNKNRVIGYKEGTLDFDVEYSMLLDDGLTCNDCIYCKKCCSIYGQTPYINDGKCQWYPCRFSNKNPHEHHVHNFYISIKEKEIK